MTSYDRPQAWWSPPGGAARFGSPRPARGAHLACGGLTGPLVGVMGLCNQVENGRGMPVVADYVCPHLLLDKLAGGATVLQPLGPS
ncbi:hypothetical protein GCM10010402_82140 [Actinomadura luteofluorescens]